MDERAVKKAKIGDLVREAYDSSAARGYGMILTKAISQSGYHHRFHVQWFRPSGTNEITQHACWDLVVYDP
jgi:hypothetical protein